MRLKIDRGRFRNQALNLEGSGNSSRSRHSAVYAAAFVLVFLTVELLLTQNFLNMPVMVNGVHTTVTRGAVVDELGRFTRSYQNGDILSADGKVIDKGAGNLPLVYSGRKKLQLDEMILPKQQIRVVPGTSKFEPFVLQKIETQYAMSVKGKGPIYKLENAGAKGFGVEMKGVGSGKSAAVFLLHEKDLSYERRLLAKGRYIALTFDDGPSRFTPGLLNYLRTQKVKATFFVTGKNAEKYPWLIRLMVKDGHMIGNHTYGHTELTKLPLEKADLELRSASKIVEKAGGGTMEYFRPPYGSYNDAVLQTAFSEGLVPVMWSIDPRDWSGTSAPEIYDHVLSRTRTGAVVLLHDGGGVRSETVLAVQLLVPKLKELGFQFVTIDEMIKISDRQ